MYNVIVLGTGTYNLHKLSYNQNYEGLFYFEREKGLTSRAMVTQNSLHD